MSERSQSSENPSSELALSRYLLVSQVLSLEHQGVVRAEAAEQVAARVHRALNGDVLVRSARTIQRWVAAWERDGVGGLEPAERTRTSSSLVLPQDFLDFLRIQKQLDIRASIPELIQRAVELGIVEANAKPDRTTVWRACRRMGVTTRRRKSARERDSRRFAYPHRMQMVLSDGKHFRAGAVRAKRVALFFIDDCSRYGLHVVVGTSENKDLFLRGLYEMLRRVGFFTILYLDHGPGFIALDTIEVVRKLNALLIHGEGRYPEGHGKVEKFNQTAKGHLLRNLDRRPDIDPDCHALELRLQHWLHHQYNHSPHESLENQTPFDRFHADPRPLSFPQDDADLRQRFVMHLERDVSNDHVVSVDGVAYEVPRGNARTRVRLYRQALNDHLSILHEGRMLRIHPVDLAANAHARRASSRDVPEETTHPLPPSAADLAYQRDFRPVVGPDGGFPDHPHSEEE